jgi:uncharacterized protein YbjQ (UPF0145 family)
MRACIIFVAIFSCSCATWTTAAERDAELRARAAGILVTPESGLDRDIVLVEVLDFHTDADSEDKGFDALRLYAAEIGADAVIGAEFEHGEPGERSHLSGMAVKYVAPDNSPYDVLGEIDIATPEDAEDKGLSELDAAAARMGADEVRSIHFFHSEEDGMSHLTGVAVKHRRR